jgi:hypothetical protein
MPAAVAVLAAVVLAITGYLILHFPRKNPDGCRARARSGIKRQDASPVNDLRPSSSECLADTDVRKMYAVYRAPPQVPRIVPDIPEQCWCGHGPRGHLPAYVTEVLRG